MAGFDPCYTLTSQSNDVHLHTKFNTFIKVFKGSLTFVTKPPKYFQCWIFIQSFSLWMLKGKRIWMNRNVELKESILPDIKFNTKPNLQTRKLIKMLWIFVWAIQELLLCTPILSSPTHQAKREKRKNNLISLPFILLISKVGQSLPCSEHYHL